MNTSFIMQKKIYDAINNLSEPEQLKVYKAINEYVFYGTYQILEDESRSIFIMAIHYIEIGKRGISLLYNSL